MSWVCMGCGEWFAEGASHYCAPQFDAETIRLAEEATKRVAEPGWIERVAAEVATLTD